MNCHVFLELWSDYLLSAAAWLQVSLLCRQSHAMAVCACQKVVHRLVELHTTRWSGKPAVGRMHFT